MGGEPLLCKNLNEYIAYAKKKKVAEVYRVLSNGLLTKTIDPDLFKEMDILEISHYPQMKESIDELYAYLKPLSRWYNFSYYIKDIKFFNKIDTISITNDEAQKGYEQCSRIADGGSIYNGYFYKCMRPKTTNLYLEKECGIISDVDMKTTDGVLISDDDFLNGLKTYRSSKTMLESCKYCLMGLETKISLVTQIQHIVFRYPLLVRLFYKSTFLYHTYKKFKKIVSFDEGAHSNGNSYVETKRHETRLKNNLNNT